MLAKKRRSELGDNVEQSARPITTGFDIGLSCQPGQKPASSVILDAMVNQAKGVMLLSSCMTQDFAQACIEFEGKRYLIKLMEI